MKKKLEFALREDEEFIPLIHLLKIMQVAGSGGEAQAMVLDKLVCLNGAVETRKRAKIRPGDVVTAMGFDIVVLNSK
jgi:ribosome-associated protein